MTNALSNERLAEIRRDYENERNELFFPLRPNPFEISVMRILSNDAGRIQELLAEIERLQGDCEIKEHMKKERNRPAVGDADKFLRAFVGGLIKMIKEKNIVNEEDQ